ncbi:EH signature domain-containing protein [Falsiruegeria mediterranea]|uniref:Zorya protein ZorC EH domain-containing protein n=1 Tax=Falsiruegeria mediterranea M17 TaxID=1200281 RepID=A0A2R8CAM6_9RHOB|nr:EH signature domain-containing protein [Falsiruegeria mediterranea]SPJ29418.1 hypothetical protein TRM7615_02936 [Falsiruegeria mediterranea M17]
MKGSDVLSNRPAMTVHAMPALDPIRSAVGRVLKRWPDAVKVPQDHNRERMAMEMLNRVQRWSWDGVKTSFINSAAVAVFDSQRRERADLAQVRDFYLAEINARPAGAFLNAMVWVYIDSFSPKASHTRDLAKALNARKDSLGARAQSLVGEIPDFFSPSRTASALGKVMQESSDPFVHLKKIGFRTPHGTGLCQHAHQDFIERITPKLRDKDARDQLYRWLMPNEGSVLQTGATKAVESLLSVWRDKMPSDDVRHEISEAIIGAYNDPRIHHGGIWPGFDPDLREVLMRWLTKQDMKFFCDTVTATQSSHHWPPRRDFWLNLYDDGMIDEAWVAFGSSARRYAQTNLVKSGTTDLKHRFGRQLDRGGSTSLLIMRIGRKIVVDGCHSYKTHIFDKDDPKAPKLYGTYYYCDDIMRSSRRSKPHNSIPSWKNWVMQYV